MKVRLIVVGKPRDPELRLLHDRFAERIRRFGVDYTSDWVAETRAGGQYSDDHVRQREGLALEEKLTEGGSVVLLEREGTLLSSEQLAVKLSAWSVPRLTLLVGGPLGLDARLRRRASACWSLSPLTFPHELVRVLIAEQLYRGLTIQRGLPYHK